MTDQANGEAPRKPRIVIEFSGPKEADCGLTWSDDVTTGQLYAAAWTLDAVAHELRAQEVASMAGGIKVAPQDALAILDRLGFHAPGAAKGEPHG